jgi:hypothetical protein
MKTFKDINGRDWLIAVNVTAIKRVRDLANFDLLSVAEDKNSVLRLSSDPILLVDVLYALVKPQADGVQISDVNFGEALGSGDVIEAAAAALLEDLADFFPAHRRGPLKAALAKVRKIQSKAAQLQIERIESPELEQQVLGELARAMSSGIASGSSQE